MRRLTAIAVVLAAVSAGLLATGASQEGKGKRYRLVFDNAFGLVKGGDVKVGGVRAGRITKLRLTRGGRPLALVEVEITEPGLDDFRSDARCEIKPQSLIGEYFVDCQPGSSPRSLGRKPLPVEQTSSGIPLDLINNVLRRPYRERLRLLISELGAGLAGRPEDLSEVLRRAHPGLRETSRVLQVLGRQNRSIKRFIANADAVVAELAARRSDVARFVTEAGDTAEASASRRRQLRGSVRRLPRFLDELRPTMARLGDLADQQTPLLADLRRAAPSLDVFLARLGPFSQAARPALRSLGPAAQAARRAFRRGSQEARVLRAIGPDAPPTAKPLRQSLQSFDDRRRAFVDDPRAKASAPPAPDPTAIPEGEEAGFTGLEALPNYFFWQALSVNRFDSIGHVLQIVGVFNECVEYQTGPVDDSNRELFERCNQWLGPYQPGVNAPDPTETGTAPGGEAGAGSAGGAALGGSGAPEARRLQGQPDLSRPQPIRLPELHDLASLPSPGTPPRPQRGNQAPASDRLLDFLLAP
jgi:phospholipid/cholesterol/gamma-HCH transport system substrate-binding protein